MEQLIHTLQGILVRAVPTFILVILLHWYLKKVLFQPMERVMEERRQRTDGVLEASEASLERARKKLEEYERSLMAAQAEIFDQQEQERKRLAARQAQAVEEARVRAKARAAEAKEEIRAEAERAKAELAAEAGRLAEELTAVVLAGGAQ